MKKYYIILLIFFLYCHKVDPLQLILNEDLNKQKIQYYFTNPYDLISNTKTKEEILNIILNTKFELYIFCYEFDDEDFILAIKHLMEKGIKVHIIGSADVSYDKFQHYQIPYKIFNTSGLHHIKMILSDRNILFVGTGNFTKSDIFYNSNLFIKLYINFNIAELIIKKFYYLDYESPIVIQTPFYKVKILKSPEDGRSIQNIINNEILNAKEYISFYIFSFFDPTIMNSLYFKSQTLTIKGLIDQNSIKDTNKNLMQLIQNSQFRNMYLFEDNLNQSYLDEENIKHGSKIHHKTIIIDNVMYTGSYNFSFNARDQNAEIFLSIEDPLNINNLKSQYEHLFNYGRLISPKGILYPSINDTYLDDKFCQSSNGNSTFFSFKNAFFYMIYLDHSGCTPDSYSSGLITNTTDGFYIKKGYSIKDYQEIRILDDSKEIIDFLDCNSILCDPCSIYDCNIFKIKEWNSSINFFVLHNNMDLNHFRIWFWDGEDIYVVQIKNVQIIGNDMYYFYQLKKRDEIINKIITEGVLFLFNENELNIACIQKPAFRKNIKTFLNLLEWYDEKFLNVTNTCYITP